MRLYFARKLIMYGITFIAAVSINWAIPHIIPGNPIKNLMNDRFRASDPATYDYLFRTFGRAFRPDLPLWKQYYYYWVSLIHGDLGISIVQYPAPVSRVIWQSAPYTLGLLIPAIVLSWYVGSKIGAISAQRKVLDNTVLPLSYLLSSSPYMWTAVMAFWLFVYVWKVFPGPYAYDPTIAREWSWHFALNVVYHWALPFLSLFLVALGGWAAGMRNMIMYELESDYSHFLQTLGAPKRLVRKYAFRNAMLPQVTGLALQLGVILSGALVTEMVFTYPGLGYQIFRGIMTRDYFLVQGIFIWIIVCVLVVNFLVDIVCVLVDPRTRIGMQGGQA